MIVLVGFMGAGKTTVGKALAQHLNLDFCDTDEAIAQATGLSIADLFAAYGEPGFRDLEARVIGERLRGPEVVLALGGGAVTTESVRQSLIGHRVVLLDISLVDALSRIGGDPGRPMLNRPDIEAIFSGRQAWYRQVAILRLPVAGRSVDQLVEDIIAGLEDPGTEAARHTSPDAPGLDRRPSEEPE